ncbi:hypothetical protein BOTBODRAFT_105144 [Botryobasidium botryosum FD-172 SS1]|uniref:Uncharacterized protein n=1 Tax=Botryobasidium botryosum (strain FD-172 SS1) TaxID=930990 RepID=A0A067MSJ1_BOTB1|nr:hypothetical protein BOTBODRAFT_105144 [Botryobasidium botryosum FD-172 SS1]
MAEVRRPERFRILIIGRANAGKTTILRAVCGVDEEPEVYDQEGNKVSGSAIGRRGWKHCIDYELRFPSNPGFVFHDSRGFESGAVEELELVRKFIQEQANLGSVSKQLHAIWYKVRLNPLPVITAHALLSQSRYCFPADIPVIAVFTKFDALDSAAFTALSGPGVSFEEAKAMAPKHATEKFNAEYLPLVESLAHPPKAVVCLRNMHNRTSPAVIQKAVSELVEKTEAALDTDALRVLLVQAQRVNVELCMKAAVNRWASKVYVKSFI